jgi:hypothetical protein
MERISQLKTSQRILIVLTIVVLLATTVFFLVRPGESEDLLSQAITGGEFALTSVGRNYESLTQFSGNNETQAMQLLQAARAALENARAKLNSVGRVRNDEYLQGMVDNYRRVVNASDVMGKGVDNLLTVNYNMTAAVSYYLQGNFEAASEKASYCLNVLTPLLTEFDAAGKGLTGINDVYVPSGQSDRLALGINQYNNETETYNQYVLLLRSLMEGKDYLQQNAQLENLLKQLQSAIANQQYETAEELRKQISDLLERLRDPRYQNAADLASQLNPDMLSGSAAATARQLRDRLRNLEGLDDYQNYLQALQKYVEAMSRMKDGDPSGAEEAMNQGRALLGSGRGGDLELQGLYAGLREAFNTLEMMIKGQPPQG